MAKTNQSSFAGTYPMYTLELVRPFLQGEIREMRIEVDKDLLLKSIGMVDALVPSRSVNAVLSNCLFNVGKNSMQISATDNEIGIKTTFDVSADNEISFTAGGTRLSGLLKELPGGVILLDIKDSFRIDIKTKSTDVKGDFSLIGNSADDFPEIPDFQEKGAVEINQNELKNMIKKVVYAAANDTIKPFFNGVFFVSQSPENMTLVATDSKRLSTVTRNLKNEISLGEGVIIPLKAVHELQRLLSGDGMCSFSVKDNQCYFKMGNTEFVTRTVDHKFPNYTSVIPKEQEYMINISRSKLMESVRRALIFTRPPSNTLICYFKKDLLTIEVKTAELGECIEDINLNSNNIREETAVGLNGQFLYESIREMDSDTINVGITGQMSPVKLVPDNDPDFISVIMPIKIKSQESE